MVHPRNEVAVWDNHMLRRHWRKTDKYRTRHLCLGPKGCYQWLEDNPTAIPCPVYEPSSHLVDILLSNGYVAAELLIGAKTGMSIFLYLQAKGMLMTSEQRAALIEAGQKILPMDKLPEAVQTEVSRYAAWLKDKLLADRLGKESEPFFPMAENTMTTERMEEISRTSGMSLDLLEPERSEYLDKVSEKIMQEDCGCPDCEYQSPGPSGRSPRCPDYSSPSVDEEELKSALESQPTEISVQESMEHRSFQEALLREVDGPEVVHLRDLTADTLEKYGPEIMATHPEIVEELKEGGLEDRELVDDLLEASESWSQASIESEQLLTEASLAMNSYITLGSMVGKAGWDGGKHLVNRALPRLGDALSALSAPLYGAGKLLAKGMGVATTVVPVYCMVREHYHRKALETDLDVAKQKIREIQIWIANKVDQYYQDHEFRKCVMATAHRKGRSAWARRRLKSCPRPQPDVTPYEREEEPDTEDEYDARMCDEWEAYKSERENR